jgi:hypothetical protein
MIWRRRNGRVKEREVTRKGKKTNFQNPSNLGQNIVAHAAEVPTKTKHSKRTLKVLS